jgi:hypothetical protein
MDSDQNQLEWSGNVATVTPGRLKVHLVGNLALPVGAMLHQKDSTGGSWSCDIPFDVEFKERAAMTT